MGLTILIDQRGYESKVVKSVLQDEAVLNTIFQKDIQQHKLKK